MEDSKDPSQDFMRRLSAAKLRVSDARALGDGLALANALKELGNIERRRPAFRADANRTYTESASLYSELGMPLEASWIIRHIGINHESTGLFDEAEKCYDEALALFREHAAESDSNYANTVRYAAVIKHRVGKRDESTALWEEAVRRYDTMRQPLGVAEGAAWLAVFAFERGEGFRAREWLVKAETAASQAQDGETDKWIEEVRSRLNDS